MRKQRSTARRLPFERGPERIGIDTHEQKILLAGEMLGRGFLNLRCTGKMDEAVGQIDRRAMKDAARFRFAPQLGRHDLVDGWHWNLPSSPRKRGPIHRSLSKGCGVWVPGLAIARQRRA